MTQPWQAGFEIGRVYRLEKLIGRGGVGEVWLALDQRLDRRVAVKVITEQGIQSNTVERFAREARLIAQLNHPAIVQIYDVGRDKDSRFIVMEYVNGLDLATLLGQGKIRIGWALRIARQIAEALKFAHKQGVVHRDIKPSNILIDANGEYAKLSDFGLAKIVENISFITQSGAVVGTPAYMSPEQFQGSQIGSESDIYSFGATLYHLFTGRPPRENLNLIALAREGMQSIPEPPNKVRPDLPEKLSTAILAMLEPDLSKRIQSLEPLIQRLGELNNEYPFPGEGTLVERAIEQKEKKESAAADSHLITQIKEESAPTGFFESQTFPKTKFFEDDGIRYTKIQESLKFYRDHLSNEYQSLLKQANTTYQLWLACVILGFLTLLSGIVAMLSGNITEGVATTASTVLIFFIQRVFQQREDHYRELAKAKNSHLEYGNQWLLIIQSIDSIENPTERAKRQARLVDALTTKLKASKPT